MDIIRTMQFDAYSDFRTRSQLKQEDIQEAIRLSKNNIYKGTSEYFGECLVGCGEGYQAADIGDPNNPYYPILVRILGVHDHCIPEPSEGACVEAVEIRKSMHHVCYPDRPHNQKLGFVPTSGQIVNIYFSDGPRNKGHLRGVQYRYPMENKGAKSVVCTESTEGIAREAIETGDTKIFGETKMPDTSDMSAANFLLALKSSPSFQNFSREALIAIAANAQGESTFNKTVGGDLAANMTETEAALRAVIGPGLSGEKAYCSWGFWQLNICKGAGLDALSYHWGLSVPETKAKIATPEGKADWIKWLQTEENQFKFVAGKLKILGVHEMTDIDKAIKTIVEKFERSAEPGPDIVKRKTFVAALENEYDRLFPGESSSSETSENP